MLSSMDAHDGLARTEIDSPFGPLTLLAGPQGLRAIRWPGERPDETDDAVARASAATRRSLHSAAAQLGEYFAGGRTTFDLPLAPVGTPFQLAVWEVLRTIPYGVTISYGEQARRLGDPKKARAVGGANGRNPLPIVVPCHRVIGASGKLVGFGGGLDAKAWLLDHERRALVAAMGRRAARA